MSSPASRGVSRNTPLRGIVVKPLTTPLAATGAALLDNEAVREHRQAMRRLLPAAVRRGRPRVLVAAPAALAWTWPADGLVLRPFSLGPDPYAAGQHRGRRHRRRARPRRARTGGRHRLLRRLRARRRPRGHDHHRGRLRGDAAPARRDERPARQRGDGGSGGRRRRREQRRRHAAAARPSRRSRRRGPERIRRPARPAAGAGARTAFTSACTGAGGAPLRLLPSRARSRRRSPSRRSPRPSSRSRTRRCPLPWPRRRRRRALRDRAARRGGSAARRLQAPQSRSVRPSRTTGPEAGHEGAAGSRAGDGPRARGRRSGSQSRPKLSAASASPQPVATRRPVTRQAARAGPAATNAAVGAPRDAVRPIASVAAAAERTA